jgi:glucose/arabinose dehydrogenase
MFVGDIKFGNIYDFKLNYNRTELVLNDTLADIMEEADREVFGSKFGGITDLTLGPDGYLYVLVFDAANGTIFKVGK